MSAVQLPVVISGIPVMDDHVLRTGMDAVVVFTPSRQATFKSNELTTSGQSDSRVMEVIQQLPCPWAEAA